MVRRRTRRVSLFKCLRDFFADRPLPTSIGSLPGEPILAARSADDSLRVLVHFVFVALSERKVVLRLHVTVTQVDGVEFIAPDAAIEKFLAAGSGIKGPLITSFDNRYRKRPVFVADEQECPSARFGIDRDTRFLPCLGGKVAGTLAVLWKLPGEDDVLAARSENRGESSYVKFLGCFHQGVCGFLRSFKIHETRGDGNRRRLRFGLLGTDTCSTKQNRAAGSHES